MDYDFSVRFTRSGRVIQKPIVLHDADISDPETQDGVYVDKESSPTFQGIFPLLIVERSHIYVTLCSSNFQTNESELETFPEVLLKMGLVLMPQYSIAVCCKWGFKVISPAGKPGLFYDFIFYDAKNLIVEDPLFFQMENYVLKQCETLPKPNRLRGCPPLSEKDLKSSGRGAYDSRTDAWYDNRHVLATSTYIGVKPKTAVRRWEDRRRKKLYKRRSKRCLEQAQAQSFTCQATPAVTTNGKTTDQLTSQQKWQRIKLATGQKSHKFEEDADCGLHQPHACAINAVFTNA
ncbi:hypothetical protein T01_3468 [Trichinella spiralis]|uniref:Uncharacterized protein n=1 Tax=Trichinella spiralis TaxID=6334 RepID=A0A0V1ANV4_TRISP|nr:hypothetical protein T01_3468 [Trichinella spiralis]